MPFPISEDELIKTENTLSVQLPTHYRNSMMLNNGGSVEAMDDFWELFPIQNTSSKKLISRTSNHILTETEFAKGYANFPKKAIAIAGNGTGDLLLFNNKNGILEEIVFYWNHEDGSLTPITNNFSELTKS